MALPYSAARSGVNLAVRIAPKAAASRVLGLVEEAGGGSALKLAIHAPPENGKANADLIALLADLFDLPKRDVSLAAGASNRRKLVHIAGDPARLLPRIEEGLLPWLKRG
jgi:uncharacterized protein (TIGR00251 family)